MLYDDEYDDDDVVLDDDDEYDDDDRYDELDDEYDDDDNDSRERCLYSKLGLDPILEGSTRCVLPSSRLTP